MFFASAIIYVEGVAEQFIIPEIAKKVYGINLSEHNISVIPIHCRYFDPYLKIVQDDNLEIPTVAIIDGDSGELDEDETTTTAIENARSLEIKDRVIVSSGKTTLEIDLFPNNITNKSYLKNCFDNLNHSKSYSNLITATSINPQSWEDELIKRIDKTVTKGRFAQELSLLIDKDFLVPNYIKTAILHIAKCKNIILPNAQ
jgi:putative ATP-dependent endonuclease of the OLD family